MKIGFVCCIHSNFEALQSVGRDIDAQKCDKVYCLGDIVGYGPQPHECIDYIRGRNWPSLLGNHEAAVLDPSLAETTFNPSARNVIHYTMGAITKADRAWLKSLPESIDEPEFQIVHASPLGEHLYLKYILTVDEAKEAFAAMKKKLLFHGHTHIPSVVFNSEPISYSKEPISTLDKNTAIIVDVGSVGQPRDKDNRSSYAILDTVASTVEIRRVAYDVAKAGAELLERGLPEKFAKRLAVGV
jgi:diadenosine tetraphosphatase ApaH/serine/threonine PP2A family protein phosphatase